MIFPKTIKFEKIKLQTDDLVYYTINDEEAQRVILEYCIEKNIEIKRIYIYKEDITVKLKCTGHQANEFASYMIKNYYKYFKNFKF